jgi:hypothetical protein
MKNKILPLFNCSQPALYSISSTIYENASNHREALAEFKAKYTTEYLESFRQQIEQARALPSQDARTALHETVRIELVDRSKDCLKKWQFLKRYIYDAYPQSMHKAMYNAAGWQDYEKAASQNWEHVSSLMSSGYEFIRSHQNALMANDNMPAGFPDLFQASFEQFTAAYELFKQRMQQAAAGTQAKMEANNALYLTAISICEDGYQVFSGNPALQQQFSFNRISEMVTPPGASSVIVTVTSAVNNQPLPMTTVTVRGVEYTTNAQGRMEKHQLSAGPADIRVEADGYLPFEETVTLNTGTAKHIRIQLAPLFTGALTPGPQPSATITEETPEPQVSLPAGELNG